MLPTNCQLLQLCGFQASNAYMHHWVSCCRAYSNLAHSIVNHWQHFDKKDPLHETTQGYLPSWLLNSGFDLFFHTLYQNFVSFSIAEDSRDGISLMRIDLNVTKKKDKDKLCHDTISSVGFGSKMVAISREVRKFISCVVLRIVACLDIFYFKAEFFHNDMN